MKKKMNEQMFPCTEKRAETGNCLNVIAILEKGTGATSHFKLEDCRATVIRNQYSAIYPKISSTELLELLQRLFFCTRRPLLSGKWMRIRFFPLTGKLITPKLMILIFLWLLMVLKDIYGWMESTMFRSRCLASLK